MPDYARMIEAAREAVTFASAVCRQVQRSLDEVRAITKDDKSPVTVADYASQAIVAWVLRERLGEFVLVGEEVSGFLRQAEHAAHLEATVAAVQEIWGDATGDEVLDAIDQGSGDTKHHAFWTLDPVDGTKGFLRNQQYAIALGYIEGGIPTMGVLGCPNLPVDMSAPLDEPDPNGCLYYGIRGEGVYEAPCDDEHASPTRITRLDHAPGDPILVCASVEKAHSNVDDTDRILAHVGEPHEMVRLDSQAKYAVVARGQADAYLRLPTKKGYVERIWDHAAGAMIANEAGAAVTDIHGKVLDFSQGRGLEKNRGIVCAPSRVAGLVIGAIRELGIGQE